MSSKIIGNNVKKVIETAFENILPFCENIHIIWWIEDAKKVIDNPNLLKTGKIDDDVCEILKWMNFLNKRNLN